MEYDKTKELIVLALKELLTNTKLSNITIKDIAKKANISRQTFYRHFKDKYDLITWYYDQEIEALFIETLSIDGIRKNLIAKCARYKENRAFYRHAYQCDKQNALGKHEFQRIFDFLSDKIYQNTGIKKEEQSFKMKYSLEFFCHGLIQMTIDWLNRSCPMPCETFADIIIELMPDEIKTNLKAYD